MLIVLLNDEPFFELLLKKQRGISNTEANKFLTSGKQIKVCLVGIISIIM